MTKVILIVAIVIGLFNSPCFAFAGAGYPTNLELVEQAARAAADSMDVAPPDNLNPDLRIEMGTGSEASWLVDSILKERLLAAGWRVRTEKEQPDTSSIEEPGFLLKMNVVDLGLIYGRNWRRYLFTGKVVERIARVVIYYELADLDNNEVVVSSNAKAEVRDVVPASALAALSDSKYKFASPELEKSQWDRYLEGGLVLSIVGILIYLFYSNKTAS